MAAAVGRDVTPRQASDADSPALLELFLSCRSAGMVSWASDRGDDFFALRRAPGEHASVLVAADRDDRIVACISAVRRDVHIAGRTASIVYSSDLRVHPSCRRHGIGAMLMAHAIETSCSASARHAGIYGAVALRNGPMRRLLRLQASPRPVEWFATVDVHRLSARDLPPVPGGRRDLLVRPAESADVPEMAVLWRHVAPLRDLAPELPPALLDRWMDAMPQPSPQYLVAIEDGRIAGFLALWDQGTVRALRVVAEVPLYSFLRPVLRGLSSTIGNPVAPRIGAALRRLSVLHLCVPPESPSILEALLAAARVVVERGGYECLEMALDRRDPLASTLPGSRWVPWARRSVQLYRCSPAGKRPDAGARAVHFDVALT